MNEDSGSDRKYLKPFPVQLVALLTMTLAVTECTFSDSILLGTLASRGWLIEREKVCWTITSSVR
jgi:hypothetical protein